MEGVLAILDPAPLFPEDGAVVFYDGQPRDERGRFTFGRMPDYSLCLFSPEWCSFRSKTNERTRNIMGILNGNVLSNEKIEGEVFFYSSGIKHTIGTNDSPTLERLMRSPDVLKDVFNRGDCKIDKVHKEKAQYVGKCWHVKAAVHFNNQKTSHVEFVVFHHLEMRCNVLYDVTIK